MHNDLSLTPQVKRCVMCFEQQFHYTPFYAYMKLREQVRLRAAKVEVIHAGMHSWVVVCNIAVKRCRFVDHPLRGCLCVAGDPQHHVDR